MYNVQIDCYILCSTAHYIRVSYILLFSPLNIKLYPDLYLPKLLNIYLEYL